MKTFKLMGVLLCFFSFSFIQPTAWGATGELAPTEEEEVVSEEEGPGSDTEGQFGPNIERPSGGGVESTTPPITDEKTLSDYDAATSSGNADPGALTDPNYPEYSSIESMGPSEEQFQQANTDGFSGSQGGSTTEQPQSTQGTQTSGPESQQYAAKSDEGRVVSDATAKPISSDYKPYQATKWDGDTTPAGTTSDSSQGKFNLTAEQKAADTAWKQSLNQTESPSASQWARADDSGSSLSSVKADYSSGSPPPVSSGGDFADATDSPSMAKSSPGGQGGSQQQGGCESGQCGKGGGGGGGGSGGGAGGGGGGGGMPPMGGGGSGGQQDNSALIAAIQAQQNQIAALQQEIADLKKSLQDLADKKTNTTTTDSSDTTTITDAKAALKKMLADAKAAYADGTLSKKDYKAALQVIETAAADIYNKTASGVYTAATGMNLEDLLAFLSTIPIV